jgi:hypothetical protein
LKSADCSRLLNDLFLVTGLVPADHGSYTAAARGIPCLHAFQPGLPNAMKISLSPSVQQPDETRTSIVFRVAVAVASCLFVALGSVSMGSIATVAPLSWVAGLLAGACVFVFADLLLACLVVAIPPGLFILSLAALLIR